MKPGAMSAANGRPCSCDGRHADRRLQSAPHAAIIRINEFIVASQLYAAARGALPLPLTQTSSRPPRNRGARGKGNFQKYGLDGTGFRNHCGFRSLCRYDPPCFCRGIRTLCVCPSSAAPPPSAQCFFITDIQFEFEPPYARRGETPVAR